MEKTEAIVVQTSPYSETTLIVHLLTRELGVARVLAKGARRPDRQNQAALEPFARIEATLSLRAPDSLGTLGQTTLLEGWPWLRVDVARLAYASLGVEVLAAVAGLSAPEPFFYEEACRFLSTMGSAPGPGSLTIALLMRLLHHGGFPPRLKEPWTAESLPEGSFCWCFESGALDRLSSATAASAIRIKRQTILELLPLLNAPPPLDGSAVLGKAAGAESLRLLTRVWEDHLGRPLKANRFLEKMVLRP